MKALGKYAGFVEHGLSAVVLWALFGVVGLQFITRYVLSGSFGWTEEIARHLLILLCYVGAVLCVRNRSHIRIDLLLLLLPKKGRERVNRAIELLSAGLYLWLAVVAFRFAMHSSQTLSSIEIPKSILFWIVGACLIAMGLRALLWTFTRSSEALTKTLED